VVDVSAEASSKDNATRECRLREQNHLSGGGSNWESRESAQAALCEGAGDGDLMDAYRVRSAGGQSNLVTVVA